MSQTKKITGGLNDFDLHFFNEGSLLCLYDIFGVHPSVENNTSGVRFAE